MGLGVASVEAYARFDEMGAVLDVARLGTADAAAAEAAIAAMRFFAERHDARLRALNPGRDVSGYFRVELDPEVRSGRRVLAAEEISVQEFFGPGYDVEADEVRLFHYSSGGRSSYIFEGLAHALLDPPYGLRRPRDEPFGALGSSGYGDLERAWMRRVLREFCAEVLALDDPRRAEHLRIHRFPTDWSNYFAAGLEWWGASFWILADPRNDWTTVIGASSTD